MFPHPWNSPSRNHNRPIQPTMDADRVRVLLRTIQDLQADVQTLSAAENLALRTEVIQLRAGGAASSTHVAPQLAFGPLVSPQLSAPLPAAAVVQSGMFDYGAGTAAAQHHQHQQQQQQQQVQQYHHQQVASVAPPPGFAHSEQTTAVTVAAPARGRGGRTCGTRRSRGGVAHLPNTLDPRYNQLDNARFLPYALESIATDGRRFRPSEGFQACLSCGKPRGLIGCFRECHFAWCVRHAQETEVGTLHCEVHNDCVVVVWEDLANWPEFVEYSRSVGEIGIRNVPDLEDILYPVQG